MHYIQKSMWIFISFFLGLERAVIVLWKYRKYCAWYPYENNGKIHNTIIINFHGVLKKAAKSEKRNFCFDYVGSKESNAKSFPILKAI